MIKVTEGKNNRNTYLLYKCLTLYLKGEKIMLKINRLLLVVSLFLFICCIGSCGGGGGGTTGGGTTDTIAPSNVSVSINNGAVNTMSTAVTLSVGNG